MTVAEMDLCSHGVLISGVCSYECKRTAVKRRHYLNPEDLPNISYKPGWTFTWEEANGATFLRIHVERPDAKGWDRATGGDRKVDFLQLILTPFSADNLLEMIEEIEAHETREWLRINDVLVFDPHAPKDVI